MQKYITDVHYLLWVGPILVSETWYRKLDPETQELVTRAAQEAAQYEWQWSSEQETLALKACQDRGMIMNALKNEGEWIKAARAIWPKFYDKVGGKALVDEAVRIMSE